MLIHSLVEFSDIILDVLYLAGSRSIVEIGAEFGGMSNHIAPFCRGRDGQLTVIDPSPKSDFRTWLKTNNDVRHIPQSSLEAIGQLSDVDAWLVDGDHNWYTVYHELTKIEANCQRDFKPMLVFVHDIGWPCARRDLYYDPSRIPAEYRHPFSFSAGADPNQSELREDRGFRGMGQFAFANHEGGPKNGVLTALNDFLAEAIDRGHQYGVVEIPAVFGLAIIMSLDQDWSSTIADFLLPYHRNKLLYSLEENRLRNYLRVIEWQDEHGSSRQQPDTSLQHRSS